MNLPLNEVFSTFKCSGSTFPPEFILLISPWLDFTELKEAKLSAKLVLVKLNIFQQMDRDDDDGELDRCKGDRKLWGISNNLQIFVLWFIGLVLRPASQLYQNMHFCVASGFWIKWNKHFSIRTSDCLGIIVLILHLKEKLDVLLQCFHNFEGKFWKRFVSVTPSACREFESNPETIISNLIFDSPHFCYFLDVICFHDITDNVIQNHG